MLYRKNIPRPESLVRIVAGLALIAVSLAWLGVTPIGLVLAASGAVGIVTGVFGYCPACAMVGRKPLK